MFPRCGEVYREERRDRKRSGKETTGERKIHERREEEGTRKIRLTVIDEDRGKWKIRRDEIGKCKVNFFTEINNAMATSKKCLFP